MSPLANDVFQVEIKRSTTLFKRRETKSEDILVITCSEPLDDKTLKNAVKIKKIFLPSMAAVYSLLF